MTRDQDLPPLASRYVYRLEREVRDLPRDEAASLVSDIREHLHEVLAEDASELDVRAELDHLGSPAQLAAETRERLGVPQPRRRMFAWLTVAMLAFGGVVLPVIGWVIGVALLWSSRAWTGRDKLIGTVLLPGGLAGFVYLCLLTDALGGASCTSTGVTGHGTSGIISSSSSAARHVLGRCTPGSALMSVLVGILAVALLVAPLAGAAFLVVRMRTPQPT
jgi:hypothetical protein